jgi:hypothetical protein
MAVTQSTWTPELDQQLADLHAQGLSLRECATRIDWKTHPRCSWMSCKCGANIAQTL